MGLGAYRFIELLYRGYGKEKVSEITNYSLRTVEHLQQSYNESGIDGVVLQKREGRPKLIDGELFKEEYLDILKDPSQVGEGHWTAIKFHNYLTSECKKELSYSTTVRYLHESNFCLRYPRKMAVNVDIEQRELFLKSLKEVSQDKEVELWFCDESGFEGDPRPRREKGSDPTIPYAGNHIRHSVVGAVNPSLGELFTLVVPGCDKEVFQVFIEEFAKKTENNNKRNILILDNASWHRSKSIDWKNITPMFLPPYSPDLNPIETIWRVIKENSFTNWYAKSLPELIDKICLAINALDKNTISSVASIKHLVQ